MQGRREIERKRGSWGRMGEIGRKRGRRGEIGMWGSRMEEMGMQKRSR
jgi:hypothetical protein